MKTCNKCDELKTLDRFPPRKDSQDGYRNQCRECDRKRLKVRRETGVDEQRQKAWMEANKEHVRQYKTTWARQWRRESTSWRTHQANSSAKRRAAIGDQKLPAGHMEALLNWYGNQCMYPDCDSTDISFDHVVPLTKSGDHSLANGQLLCRSHNSAKGNRHSTDYRDHSKGILVDTFGR